jgi:hypothetical protein
MPANLLSYVYPPKLHTGLHAAICEIRPSAQNKACTETVALTQNVVSNHSAALRADQPRSLQSHVAIPNEHNEC